MEQTNIGEAQKFSLVVDPIGEWYLLNREGRFDLGSHMSGPTRGDIKQTSCELNAIGQQQQQFG